MASQAGAPRWPAAELPSIFSNEQPETVQRVTPSGSLLDVFESHRNRQGEEAKPPPAEPTPSVAEQTVEKPPAPKPKPKPRPAEPAPAKAQDGWTIIPKGARRTD
jgi:outer membrane biosynthesis protein TonB